MRIKPDRSRRVNLDRYTEPPRHIKFLGYSLLWALATSFFWLPEAVWLIMCLFDQCDQVRPLIYQKPWV